MPDTGQFAIGIDTGGTYTDALVYCRATERVVAKAKVPTTHSDLGGCVSEALRGTLFNGPVRLPEVGLVSVSTTLATNALVEGGGRPAGLITIGLEDAITKRRGLGDLILTNPILRLTGGHSPHGLELNALDLSPLKGWVASHDAELQAYAVVGAFSVRNPEHELVAAKAIAQATGKFVTLSHELSGELDAPKRAVTALLNARLVPLIGQLIAAVESSMGQLGIDCPLMVMRGDGSLVSSEFVKTRPIETILSGPAASAIGAVALNSVADGVIVDIGGTTTDVAIISGGLPISGPAGANVGGHETMVSAIRVHTEGVGGDSHVQPSPLDDQPLSVGPRRVTPLVVACLERPAVLAMLNEQHSRSAPREGDGIYLWLIERNPHPKPRSSAEAAVISALEGRNGGGQYGEVITSGLQRNALNRLMGAGFVGATAFTPTDAAHVLGIDDRYDPEVAYLAADLLARHLDRFGEPLAESGPILADLVIDLVTKGLCQTILTAAADYDELSVTQLESTLKAQAHLADRKQHRSIIDISAGIAEKLTAVGAPADLYQTKLGLRLSTSCEVPEHSEVANAYGAATGMIRLVKRTVVSAPRRGLFRVHTAELSTHYDLRMAQDFAERDAVAALSEEMQVAGAGAFNVSHKWTVNEANVEERQLFVEATLESVAVGVPI